MKKSPLLILGKRRTGKTFTIVQIARDRHIPIICPTIMARDNIKRIYSNISGIECCIDTGKLEYPEYVVDEFSQCSQLPTGIIVALSDDINNFYKIGKRLKKLGYLDTARKMIRNVVAYGQIKLNNRLLGVEDE